MVLPRALLRWLAVTRTCAALTTTVPIPVDTRAPVRGGTRLYGVFDDVVATAEGLLSKFLPSPAPYNASQVRPGNVVRADVAMAPDGTSKGYGTVLLASTREAAKAIQLFNESNFLGRILDVRPDAHP